MEQDQARLEEERELCEQARQGDREALGALLKTHGPRLYRSVLLPRLGLQADAEEALSQVYVKIVQNFSQFTWQNVGVYPWFRTIALRVALDHLRRGKRLKLFEAEDLERELNQDVDLDPNQLERLDLLTARARVDALLDQLNPRYSHAIRGRILEERSREELASELGVSVPTFDVILHRALTALKKALAAVEVTS